MGNQAGRSKSGDKSDSTTSTKGGGDGDFKFLDKEHIHMFGKCCSEDLAALCDKYNLKTSNSYLSFMGFNTVTSGELDRLRRAPSECSATDLAASQLVTTNQGPDDNRALVEFEEVVEQGYEVHHMGGKGMRLAEVYTKLTVAGSQQFTVPQGACLTTSVYMSHVAPFNDLIESILKCKDDKEVNEKIEKLHGLMDTIELNANVKQEIATFLTKLPPGTTLAIRSSATIEDGDIFSLAGLCSSFLNVPATVNDVATNVIRCWKSMWQTRVTTMLYRADVKVPPKMSVVIQQMIESKASGVLFTLNPNNGHETEMVAEAVHGLGEGLVSGEISPTSFNINWVTGEYKEVAKGNQKTKYVFSGNSIAVVPTNSEESTSSPLSDAQIKTLKDTGVILACHYGHPQDIEWAFDSQGRLWVTQTRPITKVNCQFKGNWTSGFADHMILTGSIMSHGFAKYLRMLNKVGDDVKDEAICRVIFGIPYARSKYNNTAYHFRSDEIQKIMRHFHKVAERFADHYHKQIEPHLHQIISNIASVPTEDLASILLKLIADYTELDFHSFTVGFFASQILDEVVVDVQKANIKSEEKISLGPLTMQIHPGVGQALRDIKELAALIFQDKDLTDKIIEMTSSQQVVDSIQHGNEELKNAFERFFERNFWFCDLDEDILGVRWLDNPNLPLRVLQSELKRAKESPTYSLQPDTSQIKKDIQTHHQRAESVPDKKLQAQLKTDLNNFKTYMYLKEEVHVCYARMNYYLCKLLYELGLRWAKQNYIENPVDLHFLNVTELQHIVESKNYEQLRSQIYKNKNVRLMLLKFQKPLHLCASEFYSYGDNTAPINSSDTTLIGLTGSAGAAKGKARVMLDLKDAEKLRNGEILVATNTSPGWTPLFSLIAGLITEEGGTLSHGAVVAREFQIPALLRVGDATKKIKTGQMLHLDASRGFVEIVPDETPQLPPN